MQKVTKEVLKLASNKLMFEMSESEYDNLLKDFDSITKQMKLLDEISGVDEVEPMVFPFEVTNSILREDVAKESLSREDALSNAKEVENGQIKLPRVVK